MATYQEQNYPMRSDQSMVYGANDGPNMKYMPTRHQGYANGYPDTGYGYQNEMNGNGQGYGQGKKSGKKNKNKKGRYGKKNKNRDNYKQYDNYNKGPGAGYIPENEYGRGSYNQPNDANNHLYPQNYNSFQQPMDFAPTRESFPAFDPSYQGMPPMQHSPYLPSAGFSDTSMNMSMEAAMANMSINNGGLMPAPVHFNDGGGSPILTAENFANFNAYNLPVSRSPYPPPMQMHSPWPIAPILNPEASPFHPQFGPTDIPHYPPPLTMDPMQPQLYFPPGPLTNNIVGGSFHPLGLRPVYGPPPGYPKNPIPYPGEKEYREANRQAHARLVERVAKSQAADAAAAAAAAAAANGTNNAYAPPTNTSTQDSAYHAEDNHPHRRDDDMSSFSLSLSPHTAPSVAVTSGSLSPVELLNSANTPTGGLEKTHNANIARLEGLAVDSDMADDADDEEPRGRARAPVPQGSSRGAGYTNASRAKIGKGREDAVAQDAVATPARIPLPGPKGDTPVSGVVVPALPLITPTPLIATPMGRRKMARGTGTWAGLMTTAAVQGGPGSGHDGAVGNAAAVANAAAVKENGEKAVG